MNVHKGNPDLINVVISDTNTKQVWVFFFKRETIDKGKWKDLSIQIPTEKDINKGKCTWIFFSYSRFISYIYIFFFIVEHVHNRET